jgi:3-oxoacyl-[acyl-carrier-protein] synthase II
MHVVVMGNVATGNVATGNVATGNIVVTGMGLRSALGDLAATWQNLHRGKSGIWRQQPFLELPVRPLGLLDAEPALGLADLTQQVVAAAIADAGLAPPLPDCAIVLGSSRGNQARFEQRLFAEDGTPWLDCLPHAASVIAARILQTRTIVLSPMAACATGISAIARGMELIAMGECEQVLVGAVETPVTRLTLAGFAQMGALAPIGAYPFDRQRQGFVLGEGGAVLLLESERSAQARGAPQIYGSIVGFGLTADAYHLSSPQPEGRGAIAAIQQGLDQANIDPAVIAYIHAHGTATRLNDATEAQVIGQLFPHRPWVSSTKGATGHTLGASGALGVAFCLLALHEQKLPPAIGLSEPEFDLNLVTQCNQSTPIDYAISNAFGFGGQNGTIVLRRYAG